jgi:hypothetical protein
MENSNIISHIQVKIKSLKNEIKAIEYTNDVDGINGENDTDKINELTYKIQVLNEILISFGIQKIDF